ncbi:MAG: M28 family metallopeptidase [candidate division WOR-3 bacterium]
MNKTLTVFFFTITTVSLLFAKDFLALVSTNQGLNDATLMQQHFRVLAQFEDCWLVQADEPELIRLQQLGAAVQKFDLPEGKELFYVQTRPGFDRHNLSRYGTILGATSAGILLATDESALPSLNRLPVELCRLALEPLTIYPEAPLPPPVAVSESLVLELVSRVNPDSVLAHIRRLQDFYTRYSTTESCRAAVEWMRNRLVAYGCDSTALETYRTGYAPNVIGVKTGRLNPNPIYVLCGHIDNTSDYAPQHCPGSDDNASGTAAVLEAARVFQDIDFAYSVYFIGFTGEEQGLWGSDSFCRRAARRGDSIRAALNFDMVSYGRQNLDSFEVIGKISSPACAWLVDSFIANARTYTALKPIRRLVNSAPYSDHHSFWQRGYPALCGIEHDFTPEYHTIGDTIGPLYFTECGTNNWLMATEAIRAAVATIAKLAGAQPQTGIAQSGTAHLMAQVSPTIGRPPFYFVVGGEIQTTAWSIYDPGGRKVARVNSSVWTGKDLQGRMVAPGVYFCRQEGRTAPAIRLVVCH